MTSTISSSQILLVCSPITASEKIKAAFASTDFGSLYLECVERLSDARNRIKDGGIAGILLALTLPDSEGIETFERLFGYAGGIPILILCDETDEPLAVEAIKGGAADYLLPIHLDTYSLSRALRNAIERKGAADALLAERERALVTLNSIGDAVLCTDISGNVSYLNRVAETLTGWTSEEAVGRPIAEIFAIIDGATRKTAQDPMKMAMDQNRTVGLTANCVLIRRDGMETAIEDSAAPIRDSSGRVIGAVIVFHDVSAARAMAAQMTFAAQHDVTTNLPNRFLLNDRIAQAISLAHRRNQSVGLLFLDVDGFKQVNDSLGHALGDQLLLSISRRLSQGIRQSDTVSRLGGDEFVILLSEIAHANDAETAANKILVSVAQPHLLGEDEVHISCSIGISIYPDDGRDAVTLIKNADAAMYHAKDSGRNRCQRFRSEMNNEAVARNSMAGNLRHALGREEFLLHYQPKIDLSTGEIKGVEALIRWHRKGQGLMQPTTFISVAETSGLIVAIGRWVMRSACQQARAWQDAGLPHLQMAVNVSAIELQDKDFIRGVRTVLSETGLAAGYLEIELTESVLMSDITFTAAVLEEIKGIGVQVAIDDFGTGYSSLSYLSNLAIDTLKIDKSFIRKISSNPDDSTIISAIISMAKSLKYLVIAEGVETEEQKAYLQSLNCDWAQGFLFSQPLDAVQFAQLLEVGIHAAT